MKDHLFNGKILFSVLAILLCLAFTTVSYGQDNGEVPAEEAPAEEPAAEEPAAEEPAAEEPAAEEPAAEEPAAEEPAAEEPAAEEPVVEEPVVEEPVVEEPVVEEPVVEEPVVEEPVVEEPVVEEPVVEEPVVEEPVVEEPVVEEPVVEEPMVPEGYGFDVTLEPGLNMISIPLMPAEPYTAKSLAEMLGATVVIQLDATTQRFTGYTVADEGDGFGIDGGMVISSIHQLVVW